jgi:Tfp pilus assembly protein PilZ
MRTYILNAALFHKGSTTGGETMQPMNFDDRRKFTRFEVDIPIKNMAVSESREVSGKTHDISVRGIGVVSQDSLRVGTELDLHMMMPDNGEEIRAKGTVVWSTFVGPNKYRAGVYLDEYELKPIPLVLRTIKTKTRYYV